MEEMSTFEKRMRLATSLTMLTIEKILVAIVVPLIAKWEWATMDSPTDGFSRGIQNVSSTYFANATNVQQLKASPQLTLIFLAYSLLDLMFSPLSGILGDKFGLDCIALGGAFLAGVICILYALFNSLSGILIARLLQGVCSAFLSPTAFARLAEAFADDDFAANRVMNCAMATTLFSFVGPGIAGITFQYLGAIPCFMTILAIATASFVGIAITFRPGRITTNPNKDINQTQRVGLGFSLLDIVKDSQIQAAVLLMTSSWLPRTFLEPTLSIWISNTFNGGPAIAGIVWGTAGLSVITSSIFTAQFTISRPDYMWLFGLVNIVGTGIPLILLPQSTNPVVAAVAFSLCIYTSFCVRNTLLCLYKSIADIKFRSQYALVMGVFHIGFSLPYVIGAPVAVPLFNEIGFQLMCIVVASVLWVSSPLLICFRQLPADDGELDHLVKDNLTSSSNNGKRGVPTEHTN